MNDQPEPISAAELRARRRRIAAICGDLGFVGRVEYAHVYSRTGGAQYCIGPSADDDIMVLYAEAFERDANPEDFNLDALIAHERRHQRLHRDANLRPLMAKFPGEAFEEVLASLVGSLILTESESSETLVWKATMELGSLGVRPDSAVPFIDRLRQLLRRYL